MSFAFSLSPYLSHLSCKNINKKCKQEILSRAKKIIYAQTWASGYFFASHLSCARSQSANKMKVFQYQLHCITWRVIKTTVFISIIYFIRILPWKFILVSRSTFWMVANTRDKLTHFSVSTNDNLGGLTFFNISNVSFTIVSTNRKFDTNFERMYLQVAVSYEKLLIEIYKKRPAERVNEKIINFIGNMTYHTQLTFIGCCRQFTICMCRVLWFWEMIFSQYLRLVMYCW